MSVHGIKLSLLTLIFSCFLPLCGSAVAQSDSVILYTPYTKISVSPGQTISYSIDLINKSRRVVTSDISLKGLPSKWNFNLKSGDYMLKQLSVLPGEMKSAFLTVEVPLSVNKGDYHFQVLAGNIAVLPLTINVSEQGTFKSEFTTKQANMQGKANSVFTFQAVIKNSTAEKQSYALMANEPRGWNVIFKYNYQQVTSVEVNPNSTADIVIEIDPPDMTEAATYKIPVRAISNGTPLDLTLEVVITGSYSMQLSTPTGLFSTDINANDQKRLELLLTNTGSAELSDIKLNAGSPVNWEVTFDPKKIDRLPAGQTAQAFVVIKAAKTAIAGDYITNVEAKTPEVSSQASFRISVKTPIIWGWTGVLVIILAIGSVFYLFRRYGRR